MMVIDNVYELNDLVYLVTDPDQQVRMVTCIKVMPIGITYEVSLGSNASDHYEQEISATKNLLNV